MNERIVGRDREQRLLQKCMEADSAQLVLVYGRRRVGKTFLVDKFFNGRFSFRIAGSYNQPKNIQIRNFMNELNLQWKRKNDVPEDWTDAFFLLREYLEGLEKDEKQVIFFDEMPWMDTPRSSFLPAFEYFWNSWGASRDNLVCIICGSATAWLVDNIVENRGGLYNRLTSRLYIEPFSLHETEEYLMVNGFEWSRYTIVETYMIMGGIPYYLSLLDNSLSYEANIDNMFFRRRALLWDEFDHLYATLFSNSGQYIRVVEALNGRRAGLTRKEISDTTGLPSNGVLTRIIENLVSSEFVRACPSFGYRKHDTVYQLSDYFTLFYFRFLKNGEGKDEHFWSNTIDSPSRRAWAGLTFEQVAMDHIREIKRKLGIGGVLTEVSSWSKKGDGEHRGAQIDILIDRRDNVINICEIKFSSDVFEIDSEYEAALRHKVECFRESTKTKKALHLTMITTYGVKKNIHSERVQAQVLMDDLFVG